MLCDFLQRNFPIRVKGMHIVNEGPIGHGLMSIIKPFLPKKLRERVRDVMSFINVILIVHVVPSFIFIRPIWNCFINMYQGDAFLNH